MGAYPQLVLQNARVDEVERCLSCLTDWARRRGDVRGLALVGSWARGVAHPGSDVDLVLLSLEPSLYIAQDDWLDEVGAEHLVRTVSWGVITERRFALPGGLEVDMGVGLPAWAAVDPLNAGTQKVAADGIRPLYDPEGLLARLLASVR